jgi:hypothetical protein
MERPRLHLFRLVTIVLILQVLIPMYITLVSDLQEHFDEHRYHAERHSIALPLLLRENDESETEVEDLNIHLIQLIDFTEHSSFLRQYHNTKLSPLTVLDQIDHSPPLFTLHGVFLI